MEKDIKNKDKIFIEPIKDYFNRKKEEWNKNKNEKNINIEQIC